MRPRGFTLIELLIVVAIIAILAAIAVPNFLEAQTRAKVSRVKADIRSLATAIEAYRVDWNAYVNDVGYGWPWYVQDSLSTPVAYITSAYLQDPFREAPGDSTSHFGGVQFFLTMRFRYINYPANLNNWGASGPAALSPSGWVAGIRGSLPDTGDPSWSSAIELFGQWKLSSAGPDRAASSPFLAGDLVYDPTNGTVSTGDILRTQREPEATQTDN